MTECKNLPLTAFLPKELTSAALNASNAKKNTRNCLGRVIADSTKLTAKIALSRFTLGISLLP